VQFPPTREQCSYLTASRVRKREDAYPRVLVRAAFGLEIARSRPLSPPPLPTATTPFQGTPLRTLYIFAEDFQFFSPPLRRRGDFRLDLLSHAPACGRPLYLLSPTTATVTRDEISSFSGIAMVC